NRYVYFWRLARMNVPNRIGKLLPRILPFKTVEKLIVLVNVTRNDVKVESLGCLAVAGHEQWKTFGIGVAQPFLDSQSIAFRLGYLLAILVEEQLIIKSFRRSSAERIANLARQFH